MDLFSEDLGSFPLSEIVPQLFDTIRRVELAYADYPEAHAILSQMTGFLTDERLGLADHADTDLAAAKRLERLLLALNELYVPLPGMKFGQLPPIPHFELSNLSTPIITLIAHGISTIDRIKQQAAN